MNSPARVIGFVNAAHFIDHYSMLIFAAADRHELTCTKSRSSG
jgi:hypothetical protein